MTTRPAHLPDPLAYFVNGRVLSGDDIAVTPPMPARGPQTRDDRIHRAGRRLPDQAFVATAPLLCPERCPCICQHNRPRWWRFRLKSVRPVDDLDVARDS